MSEWSVLEAKVARLEQQVSGLSRVLTPSGGLNPDLFGSMGDTMSVLPHEAASLFLHGTFTVASGFNTIVEFDAGGATWARGMGLSQNSSGAYTGISVSGLNRETVVLCEGWVTFPSNSSGDRLVKMAIH